MLMRLLSLCGMLAILAGCANAPQQQAKQDAMAEVSKHFDVQVYNALLANDLKQCSEGAGWDCSYAGVERIITAGTEFPDLYLELVARDKAMSQMVRDGRLAQSARDFEFQRMVANIKDREIDRLVRGETRTATTDGANRNAQITRFVDGCRQVCFGPGF